MFLFPSFLGVNSKVSHYNHLHAYTLKFLVPLALSSHQGKNKILFNLDYSPPTLMQLNMAGGKHLIMPMELT